MCLDMVEKGVVTGSVSMTVGYSNALRLPPARGTEKIDPAASSDSVIIPAVARLYERIVSKDVPIRRVTITCNNLYANDGFTRPTFFRPNRLASSGQQAAKGDCGNSQKFGKNALLKAMNFEKGATTIERNAQIGGLQSGEVSNTPKCPCHSGQNSFPLCRRQGAFGGNRKKRKAFRKPRPALPDRFSELDFTLKGLCPGDKIKITFLFRRPLQRARGNFCRRRFSKTDAQNKGTGNFALTT